MKPYFKRIIAVILSLSLIMTLSSACIFKKTDVSEEKIIYSNI